MNNRLASAASVADAAGLYNTAYDLRCGKPGAEVRARARAEEWLAHPFTMPDTRLAMLLLIQTLDAGDGSVGTAET